MPNLASRRHAPEPTDLPRPMTARQALWALIGISALFRLCCAASLGGVTNEAYYYMYAQHLDWGYFDHPPMVGLVSALGLKLAPGITAVLGLRAGFIVLFAGSTWLLARLTARSFGPRAGVLAALALNATAYYGLLVGTCAEPDGPLLFFWLLTLDRLAIALANPGRTSAWGLAGLALGAAMLSKYYAVLLPAGMGLYLLLRPSARRCLRTPGPYLALAAALAVFSPVIFWNATHGWISFTFQGARAGGFHGFRPDMLFEAITAELLALTPWIWVGLVAVLFGLVRRGPRAWSEPEAFLICQAVPAIGLFLGVATFRRIMPHWPLIGFVALMPILGRIWSERLEARPGSQRLRLAAITVVPVVLALLVAAQAKLGLFPDRKGLLLGCIPSQKDPTIDMIRWDQIASELKRRGLLDDPRVFLFTEFWRFSAQLAMATNREAPVACYGRDARSFTFWSRPEDWVGRDGIFVDLADGIADGASYVPWFSRVEPLGAFPIVRGGSTVQTVRLYRCIRQTDPYLFGYAGEGPVPRPVPRAAHRLGGSGPPSGLHPADGVRR
jgi:4-amino-4-deoxy-L-arabinose transferase-like glycosyltransferase